MKYFLLLKGGKKISILQEYEEHREIIGNGRIKAISTYIEDCSKQNINILYSDIVYKEIEYNKFDKWFKKFIEPFSIMKFTDEKISVWLSQECFFYDWNAEIKMIPSQYGNGYCLEDLFKDYLEENFNQLSQQLYFDSEAGMFSVECKNIHDAEEVAYELATLYHDEKKMINLIKDTKRKYPNKYNITI